MVPSGLPQVSPCEVGSRPVPGGGAVGYCVPFGWSGLFRCLGAQRPVAPPARRGSPFLPRNGEKEGRGQAPWTPFFYGPLVPTRAFRRLCHIVPVVGLLRYPSAYPDLERFFRVRLHSKDLGGGRFPIGYPAPLPSNGLARQGTPSRSGRQPAKNPKGPTHLSAQRTRPVGHASQSFPARRRGKKMESCFDRLRRPKHPSHPESAGFAGAVRGASPNFGRGLTPSRQLDTPVLCPPERSTNPARPSQNSHSKEICVSPRSSGFSSAPAAGRLRAR